LAVAKSVVDKEKTTLEELKNEEEEGEFDDVIGRGRIYESSDESSAEGDEF